MAGGPAWRAAPLSCRRLAAPWRVCRCRPTNSSKAALFVLYWPPGRPPQYGTSPDHHGLIDRKPSRPGISPSFDPDSCPSRVLLVTMAAFLLAFPVSNDESPHVNRSQLIGEDRDACASYPCAMPTRGRPFSCTLKNCHWLSSSRPGFFPKAEQGPGAAGNLHPCVRRQGRLRA